MAWVTEYNMEWHGVHAEGTIVLQRDGGSYIRPLLLVRDSLTVVHSIPSWEDPISRARCSFAIQNDFATFYDSLPLMTISNGQYRVIVELTSPGTGELFVGYLNCETISQVMVDNQDIRLTCSGLLSKLENDWPPMVETLQDVSLIDLIAACLDMTGSQYNILVNCTLYETSNVPANRQTLFNKIAVNTELFWKNNVERDSALEILKKVLLPFNCYLYWYQGNWFIEQYQDIGLTIKDWVEYVYGVSYIYDDFALDAGGAANILDIHDNAIYKQKGESQTLTVIPGLRQFDIKLGQKQYFNIMNGDLSDLDTGVALGLIYPPIRTWYGIKTTNDWTHPGNFLNISNVVRRSGFPGFVYDNLYNGLSTRFMVTINEDTELTIKYKIGIPHGDVGASFAAEFPEQIEWEHYWYLGGPGINGYFYYNKITDPANPVWEYHFPGSLIYGNHEVAPATDFDWDNPYGAVKEITLTIPIGQAYLDYAGPGVLPIDADLTFRCGCDNWEHTGPFGSQGNTVSSYFGDFHAAVNETPDNNLLEGEISTDFLDKKEVTLDMFDTGTWNYRNTLLGEGTDAYGSVWFTKTVEWIQAGGPYTLDKMLMRTKFRLYRIARQVIKVAYIFYGTSASWTIRPLLQFFDNKQSDKQFVVLEEIHRPESDEHEVKLYEYDDSETINLV